MLCALSPYPLDAPLNHHEAVVFELLEAIDVGLLADAGQPGNAVERRAHFAMVYGEARKAFENERPAGLEAAGQVAASPDPAKDGLSRMIRGHRFPIMR
ncbi:MAG: hypothetical protein ACREDT_11480 [Methylocella sp.]